MSRLFLILFWSLQCLIIECHEALYLQPEQIHLSLGTDETERTVTWTTLNETVNSTVWFGINTMDTSAQGTVNKFTIRVNGIRPIFIHRATLTGLKPSQTYKYHCGSDDGWSSIYTFTTFPKGNNWSPKFAVYGDLGNNFSKTLGRLQDETQRGFYDAIFHVGDMAYNLHSQNGRVGDEFMRQIEPIAAYAPYQVCPGNHEQYKNFSHYNNRFSMVSEGSREMNNHFWSYNIGPAHIIMFSTEFHYFTNFGTNQIETQYNWLEKDLIEANKPENRAQRPWIITMGHRPLYGHSHTDETLRLGFIYDHNEHQYGFEDLFYKHGVDLEFWAHEHIYERLWPIYNKIVYNGSVEEPYRNPKAPVHMITGSAGCSEVTTQLSKGKYYSAFSSMDFGYTRMTIHNKTHLYIEQNSENKKGEIIDKFYLIKEKHGFEAWL